MADPAPTLALIARCARALSVLTTTDIEALHALTASALAAQAPTQETP